MLDTLIEYLVKFVNWLIDAVCGLIDAMLSPIADLLPDLSYNPAAIVQYVSWANKWVAIDYAFGLLAGYLAFVALLVIVNWILGVIPQVS